MLKVGNGAAGSPHGICSISVTVLLAVPWRWQASQKRLEGCISLSLRENGASAKPTGLPRKSKPIQSQLPVSSARGHTELAACTGPTATCVPCPSCFSVPVPPVTWWHGCAYFWFQQCNPVWFQSFFLFLNLDHIAEALGEIAHVIVDLSRE